MQSLGPSFCKRIFTTKRSEWSCCHTPPGRRIGCSNHINAGDTTTRPYPTAKEVALKYYDSYNNKRIDQVLRLIAEDCVYEDLIYQEPFRGREAIAGYFEKIERLVPKDIKFVVEDITGGDDGKCGVRWHVELEDGTVFPFSRGVSFYEINKAGEIVFARDIVEPAIKPGAAALQGISVVAPLVRRLGDAADPNNVPWRGLAMGGFWVSYILFVLLSDIPPGNPAYMTSVEDLERIFHESLNFFYVNIAVSTYLPSLSVVPSIPEPPVDEGLFNFINAWSLMWLPLWMTDPQRKKSGMKGSTMMFLWIGTMFLTNVFMPVYMTRRLLPSSIASVAEGKKQIQEQDKVTNPETKGQDAETKPPHATAIGLVSCGIAAISVYWVLAGRPDYGGLDQRWEFFVTQCSTNRIFWAFCLDAILYYIWQMWLLADVKAPAWQRFTPFFGLVAWLLF